MAKEPLALFVWFQPETYLRPFDLIVELLPECLDKLRHRKVNDVNNERVITFRLIPLVTPEFVKDIPPKPN